MEQAGPGKLAHRPLDRIAAKNVLQSGPGQFPFQLRPRQRDGMEEQDLPEDRVMVAVVFVVGGPVLGHSRRP